MADNALDEARARDLAARAIERLGGMAALEHLFEEPHVPNPEHDLIVEDERVIVRLRDGERPTTVYIGPYTFELRDQRLVRATGA